MWARRHKPPVCEDPETCETPREAHVRAAEERTEELEQRADKVADSLWDRLRRNGFAEGIAMSWGQSPRHRREGA